MFGWSISARAWRSASKRAMTDLVSKPSARVSPGALGGAFSQTQHFSRVRIRQPDEETQLDQLCAHRVVLGQVVQCVIDGEDGGVASEGSHIHLGKVHAPEFGAVFETALAARILDQDAPHRLGCSR